MSQMLPNGFLWCRKTKYSVFIELACYEIDDKHPLLPGFIEKEFVVGDIHKRYAIKRGFNELEQQEWETSPENPFVITGTVGETWTISASQLKAYDVDICDIAVTPKKVWTKNPSNQEFLVAVKIPENIRLDVVPNSAYNDDGSIDESKVLHANHPGSKVPHNGGDYLIARHLDNRPEYMQIPPEQRVMHTAKAYHPRIVNGSVMQLTYDIAKTKEEIIKKYEQKDKEDMQRELPFGMLWCREARYSVFVQRGCYQSSHRGDELILHLDGFYTKEFLVNGKPEKYEVQRGFNILTNEHWETCPEKPFILTGTVGQRWIVSKEELEEKYDIRAEQVWIEPRKIQVKPPTGKPFYVALRIPDNKEFFIYPKSVFDAPCGFDSDKAVFGNMENSLVPHDDGDYLIARHIDGKPEYAENYQKNNTSEEAAKLYDPQIINARVFKSTFDFSRSKEEIINKEAKYLSRTPGHGLKWCIPAEYEAYLEYGVRYTKPRDGEGLFIEKECEINRELKTVYFEKGFNFYFNRWWETSFDEPYIVDDTNGERWPISKEKLLKEFEIDENDFPSDGSLIASKSPSTAQWYVAYNVPSGQRVTVVPFEAYREDGTVDADFVMHDTSPGSPWFHVDGEYIVAKHFDDKPDYVEIPENERTKEIAELYRPRLVNPNEMEARFYMAETKEEILHMCSESDPFDTFYANYGWE